MTRWLLVAAALLLGCGGSDDDSATDGGAGGGGGGGTDGGAPPRVTGDTPRGEQVDCTFFERPNGCWVNALEAIRACRPSLAEGVPIDDQPEAFGTLDATLRACAYPDGSRVTLQAPLPDIYTLEDLDRVGAFADYVYRFTLTNPGGAECLRFDQAEEPFTLHLRDGDITFSYGNLLDPANAFGQITCPDGGEFWLPYQEVSKCTPHALGANQGSYHLHGLVLGFNDDQITSWVCFAPSP